MKKTEQNFTKSAYSQSSGLQSIPTADLPRFVEDCLIDGELCQHSPKTVEVKRLLLSKLIWFLKENHFESCGLAELRRFFVYLNNGHEASHGRWDDKQLSKPLRPSTIQNYHKHIRTFFRWLVNEEILGVSPMGGSLLRWCVRIRYNLSRANRLKHYFALRGNRDIAEETKPSSPSCLIIAPHFRTNPEKSYAGRIPVLPNIAFGCSNGSAGKRTVWNRAKKKVSNTGLTQ